MKTIIVGAGEVGSNLARYLSAGRHEVTIIEVDAGKCTRLDEEMEVVVLQGSGTSPTILRRAGVEDASMLVAVTDSDDTNMMSVFVASGHLPSDAIKMARIRHQEYIEDCNLHDRFNIDVVVNPELLLAEKVKSILAVPGAVDSFSFEDGVVKVVALKATAGGVIEGLTVQQFTQKYRIPNVMIAAIIREGVQALSRQKVIIPSGKDDIRVGDTVYFLTVENSLAELMKLKRESIPPAKSLLIGGGGPLGTYLAAVLADAGYNVRLMLAEEDRATRAAKDLEKVVVLHSDPTNLDALSILFQEGVDTYIAASGDEADNTLTALLAQKMGVTRTLVITQSSNNLRLIHAVGIDTVLNPFELAAGYVLRQMHHLHVLEARMFAGEDAEAFEFQAPDDSPLLGKPLKDCKFPKGTLMAVIARGDSVIIPKGDDSIQSGDRIVVLSRRGSVPALERMFDPSAKR